jgi:hypothetical protein
MIGSWITPVARERDLEVIEPPVEMGQRARPIRVQSNPTKEPLGLERGAEAPTIVTRRAETRHPYFWNLRGSATAANRARTGASQRVEADMVRLVDPDVPIFALPTAGRFF